MKVLIVSSSPRKGGNSDVLCDQFAKGAAAAGHEVESVSLREKKLSPCRACYACMENHICAINDDMAEIFPKLVAADVIVLASPVYFYYMQPDEDADRPLPGQSQGHCKQAVLFYHHGCRSPARSRGWDAGGIPGLSALPAGRKGSGRDLRHRHLGQGRCLSAPGLYPGL